MLTLANSIRGTAWLRSLRPSRFCYDADARHRTTLNHRRNGTNIKHDSRHRRARLEDCLAHIIGDVAKLHSLFDVRSTLHQRIEDSVLITGDGYHLFDPDGMLDHLRLTGQHLQITHHVHAAVDERVEVVGFNRTCMSGFGGD